METPIPLFGVIYGLIYGGVVASAYLFMRLHTHDGGIILFGMLSSVIFILHLIIWPKLTLQGLRNPSMIFRGLLYGTTQMMIFSAQANGHTSTAIVAATMGSVFGVILGRALLKERLKGLAILGAISCFVAVFLNPTLIFRSYWGVVGGFTQGLGFALSRALMVQCKSIRQSVSTGFFMASVVSIVTVIGTDHVTAISNVKLNDLIIAIGTGLLVQYGFFQLYKMLDSQRASLLALSRLPWALGLEHLLVGTALSVQQITSGSLIAFGAAILLLDAKLFNRRV